jgi:hypothetical protein
VGFRVKHPIPLSRKIAAPYFFFLSVYIDISYAGSH